MAIFKVLKNRELQIREIQNRELQGPPVLVYFTNRTLFGKSHFLKYHFRNQNKFPNNSPAQSIDKSCKYCNEMFSENFMQNHVKLCQIYSKFMSKISNSYNCKLCPYKSTFKNEEWTRKAAISYLYSHIQNHHKEQLNSDKKESNSIEEVSIIENFAIERDKKEGE